MLIMWRGLPLTFSSRHIIPPPRPTSTVIFRHIWLTPNRSIFFGFFFRRPLFALFFHLDSDMPAE